MAGSVEGVWLDELFGVRFGRYRIIGVVGAGGMASTYLACAEGAEGFRKCVALKIMHWHLSSKRPFIDMFLDEASILGRIDHPLVCRMSDFGWASGRYYMAMEYLAGEPLSRVVRAQRARGRDHVWFMVSAVAGLCEALHAAHELRDTNGASLGVVHRDVTPQNLFLLYDGSARLFDFGVARVSGSRHDSSGVIKGKVGYMAPEQLAGRSCDRRTDVWALGVVLWELLTLCPLFRGKSLNEVVTEIESAPIPAPSERAETLPPELDAIVLRALDRDPGKRFQTAREFGDALLLVSRERGPLITPGDVGAWLNGLFPSGLERHHNLMQAALAPTEHRQAFSEILASIAERRKGALPAPQPMTLHVPALPSLEPLPRLLVPTSDQAVPSGRPIRLLDERPTRVDHALKTRRASGPVVWLIACAAAALIGWLGGRAVPTARSDTPATLEAKPQAAALDARASWWRALVPVGRATMRKSASGTKRVTAKVEPNER